MPDHVELTFLRKFIDRHNAGIPHNPRLRNGSHSPRGISQYGDAKFSDDSSTPSMNWDPMDDRGTISCVAQHDFADKYSRQSPGRITDTCFVLR